MALARAHQDHRRGSDHGATIVGPRRATHRPGRVPVVEEGLTEILERELAALWRKLIAHALVAIDRAGRLGKAGVLHLGARRLGDPMVGVHVEALVGRDPESLVGCAFEAEGLAAAMTHRHVVRAELVRRDNGAHGERQVGSLQHLAPDEGQRHAGAALIVAIAFQRIGGQTDARRIEARAREATRFGEGEDVRPRLWPIVATDAQDDACLGALGAPVPVLAVQQHAVGAGLRQGEGRGAAVGEMLLDLLLAGGRHHLGAGVHQHDAGERFVGAFGDPAHLLDIGRIEFLDGRDHRLGALLKMLPVDAVLEQRLGVHLDAALDAIGHRLAMLTAALARAAGKVDQRKRRKFFLLTGHHGLPSRAWRKRSFKCAPSCGGITNSSVSTITLTSRNTGPFFVRRSSTSWATSLWSRTVVLSAMPQPLAITLRSVPAPDSVGPLLRGLVWVAWLPVSPNFSLSSTQIARFSGDRKSV